MSIASRPSVAVSAIMPTFNKAEALSDAVASIVNQTFADWELLIVDDGSTDATAQVLARLTDPRIRVFPLAKNVGRSAARNVALRHARGRYLAICDSDDVSVATRFEQQVAFLDAHSDVGVVSGYIRAFSESAEAVMQFPVDAASIRRRFERGQMGVAHGASMVRATCLERCGYCEDLSYAEDFELFRRLSRSVVFRTIPEVLLHYRHEVGVASIREWARNGRAHRYALYRSDLDAQTPAGLTFDEFSRQWRVRLAVSTLDLLRSVHFNVRARAFSSYVLR